MVFLSSRIPPVTRENGADQAFRRERAQNALFIYASPLVVKKTFITFMLSGRSRGIREQGQGQEPGVGILKQSTGAKSCIAYFAHPRVGVNAPENHLRPPGF